MLSLFKLSASALFYKILKYFWESSPMGGNHIKPMTFNNNDVDLVCFELKNILDNL